MKKTILIAAFLGVIGLTNSRAQDIPGRNNDGVNRTDRMGGRADMMKDLNLTERQQAELKSLRDAGRTKMDEIRNDNSLTQEQKRTRMQEFQKSQREKMSAILTPAQREKMQQNAGNNRGNMRMNQPRNGQQGYRTQRDRPYDNGQWNNRNNRRDNRDDMYGRGAKGGDWKNELNLTESQEAKLEALKQENKARIDAIKYDTRLSPAKKQAQIRSFMMRQKAKRDEILSPAQQRIWDEHYSGMREGLENQKRQNVEKAKENNQYNYN